MFNRKDLNQRGVTLVELMISVLVFAIGMVAILDVGTQGTLMARKADVVYTAYNLAKNRIETLRTVPFSELGSAGEDSTLLDEAGAPDLNGKYERATTVTPSYQGDPNLTGVNVKVYYTVRGTRSTNPMEMASVIQNYEGDEDDEDDEDDD